MHGHREFDTNAAAKREGVIAGVGFFVAVVEGGGIGCEARAGAGLEFGRGGQDGEVAIERAARAADVGQAEAVDLLVAIAVPRVGVGVGAPLDHAEGQCGAGERVAAAGGADEGIDCVVGAGGRLRGSRKDGQEEQENQAEA